VTDQSGPGPAAAFDTSENDTGLASAAPVRVAGTRARAGNAMGRTRSGILEATGRAVEKYGVRRATMGDVASVAGIAKGTLYNHFRTKGDLLTAALAAGVDALADDCVALARGRGEDGLAVALRHAAETLSAHPALVRVAADEPAELVRLLLPSYDGAWPSARAAIARVMLAADPLPAVEPVPALGVESTEPEPAARLLPPAEITADAAFIETVLRWLVTFTGTPGVPGETAAGAALLARTLTGGPL
jgi:AcrR family transcriptional regulator